MSTLFSIKKQFNLKKTEKSRFCAQFPNLSIMNYFVARSNYLIKNIII